MLAGASEGGVPVARYAGNEFAARMIFAWSCEPNYFVTEPKTRCRRTARCINLISASDPFFQAPTPGWATPSPRVTAVTPRKDNKYSTVTLIPGAPHTLLNVPQA